MKRPSRFMPRVAKKPMTWVGWLSLAAIVGAMGLFVWQAPFFCLGILALMLVGTTVSTVLARRKLRQLAAERPNDSICTFARDVDCRQIDTWIVRAVYEQVQEYLSSDYPKFPLRLTDRLEKDLQIDGEEIDFVIVKEVAEKTQRDIKAKAANPYYGKVKTVGDVVMFFHQQPKLDQQSSTSPT